MAQIAHHIDLLLEQALPGWRAIVAKTDWPRWLNACNRTTGRLRRNQLDDAIERSDVRDVVAMLQRFSQEMREGWPIREIGQGLEPRTPVATYTCDQIRENYERHRRGELTGAEWNRLERDMIAAGREGRVANATPLAKNFADGR